MTDRELMQLALDALEYIHEGANNQGPHTGISWRCVSNKAEPAITALRDRLAQPTQEPVAYASDVEFDDETEIIPAEQKGKLGTAGLRIPLYIDPPASKPFVGLTDEELFDLTAIYSGVPLYRAIEAKLREKNA